MAYHELHVSASLDAKFYQRFSRRNGADHWCYLGAHRAEPGIDVNRAASNNNDCLSTDDGGSGLD